LKWINQPGKANNMELTLYSLWAAIIMLPLFLGFVCAISGLIQTIYYIILDMKGN
tara:strand:- start:7830 stop:7994 length:165 start_codon:yes stop_codon:yes gene_type:complete